MVWSQTVRVACVALVALRTWSVPGQADTAAQPAQPLQQAAAGRIVLAAVVDGRNRPLIAVEPDDFVVTENGQSREVLDVHIADYPVVLLVDDAAGDELLPDIKTA